MKLTHQHNPKFSNKTGFNQPLVTRRKISLTEILTFMDHRLRNFSNLTKIAIFDHQFY